MVEELSDLTRCKSYLARIECQSSMGGHSMPSADLAFRRETLLSHLHLSLTVRRILKRYVQIASTTFPAVRSHLICFTS
jgi:hypothetical protein